MMAVFWCTLRKMYKYDGLVVYQDHDDEGILEVVEQNAVRSLHFGSSSRQSTISLYDPETLQLPYARAMNSWLLFKDQIDNALIIGLGGGSLARFLLHHFPESRVRAVEYRASVVKVARSHFGLPMDSRLKVIVGDGAEYVRHHVHNNPGGYSLIMVDAFDVDGLANSVASIAFFDDCKSLLSPDGILAINLWATEKAVTGDCINWLQTAFNDRLLQLPVRHRGNLVVLAFNQSAPRYAMKELTQKARELEQQYQLEFPVFLKDFARHNSYTIHAVVTQ
jgi:spermidine synthase